METTKEVIFRVKNQRENKNSTTYPLYEVEVVIPVGSPVPFPAEKLQFGSFQEALQGFINRLY